MLFDLIQKRTSIRTFQNKELTAADLKSVNELLADINSGTGLNRTSVNFQLTSTDPNGSGKVTGTYGFIKNPQAFIAGTIPNNNKSIEDYGYLLEKIIVGLVQYNIGSCWLGGSFKREDFKETLNVQDGYIIPAVIPIGYPMEKRRNYEKAMRYFVKADNKKDWVGLFFADNFKTGLWRENLSSSVKNLQYAFESVRLGPSASNKQPWRLLLNENEKKVHVYLNEDPGYSGNKTKFSMQRLDAGIALYHFDSVVGEYNFNGSWNHDNPGITLPSLDYKYILTYTW